MDEEVDDGQVVLEGGGLEGGLAVPAVRGFVWVCATREEGGEGRGVALPGGELEGGEGVVDGVFVFGVRGEVDAGDGHCGWVVRGGGREAVGDGVGLGLGVGAFIWVPGWD